MSIQQTNLPGVKLHARGKVRDIYDLGEHYLIVATDRLSAFDVVLPTPIPNKGKVLTQMSAFWFEHFRNDVPNHVVSTRVEEFPTPLHLYRDQLSGR
jgi:phosphoribosylaminoimidazole-succinocarboxamide synthase